MGISLYLRASLKRRLRVHLSLFIVLTCAMMLPLMISILRASTLYGSERQLDTKHQQSPIARFYEVSPEYAADFGSIPGLFATYDEGVLTIDTLNPEDKRDADKVAAYERQVYSKSSEVGDRDGVVLSIHYEQVRARDPGDKAGAQQMLLVDAMVFVIAILIVASTYRQHIRLFQGDMAALRALGAKKRQINALFYLEFILLFVLSAAAAVGLSSGVLYPIFKYFLEVTDISNLSWVMFHVDMGSVGIHVAVFFVLAALSMRYALWRGRAQRTKPLKPRRRTGTSLQKTYLRRARGGLYSCLIVSIPVTLVLLIFFNFAYAAATSIVTPPAYDIRLDVATRIHAPFSPEELAYLRSLEGVAAVYENRESYDEFCIQDDRAEGYAITDEQGKRYGFAVVHPYRTLSESMQQAGFGENSRGVAVSQNHSRLKYKVGDTIQLFTLLDDAWNTPVPLAELEVVQTLDLMASDASLLYLPDALYDELMAQAHIGSVDIILTDRAAQDGVIAALEGRFSPLYYSLFDELLVYETNQHTQIGLFVMVCVFGGIMLILALFILSAKLNLHIAAQTPNIRTLYQIGAAKASLRKAFMRQTLRTALWGLLPPYAAMAAAVALWTGSTEFHFALDAVIIGANLMVATVWLMAYVAPVRSALARIQIKEGMA
ncbi:MAG: ABC transporter permease [Oscillospiraceae bacterium]|jgi:ABC-type antimicrobial peptide transport system permease subunit|nr:ABC transporter permease [Oscillospiraceae bacterium]